jgi:hypothetical protein
VPAEAAAEESESEEDLGRNDSGLMVQAEANYGWNPNVGDAAQGAGFLLRGGLATQSGFDVSILGSVYAGSTQEFGSVDVTTRSALLAAEVGYTPMLSEGGVFTTRLAVGVGPFFTVVDGPGSNDESANTVLLSASWQGRLNFLERRHHVYLHATGYLLPEQDNTIMTVGLGYGHY